ncbi:MAG: DNA/RNA nuclease SfsA [Firmicutes bacterium]|nr:DNA/RNA nuclease SfsA [Bacillota bacterium]
MDKILLPKNTTTASFIKRINRFVATININDQVFRAHVPSSGRMKELLLPGAQVLIAPSPPGGRTDFKLLMVKHHSAWISIDSLLPNRLVKKALQNNSIPELNGYKRVFSEQKYGNSRFDFLLQSDNKADCYLEVKSVTLVESGVARFPDAPSERGSKHLNELVDAVAEGFRGVVMFIVQRSDAVIFSPHERQDEKFTKALGRAVNKGVEVYARQCTVSPAGVILGVNLPVVIEESE